MSTLRTIATRKAEYGFMGLVCSQGTSSKAYAKQGHILPVARPTNLDWTRPGI